MTKTFATNQNNDLYLGNEGNLVINTGLLAVQSACLTATKARLGEMVLQIDNGLPFFESVWTGSPHLARFEAALRSTILSIPDVLRIINLVLNVRDGTLVYQVEILTSYGTTNFNGSL